MEQPWPLEQRPRQETAFVTADMLSRSSLWYGGVSEAYWVSSQGVAVRVRLACVFVPVLMCCVMTEERKHVGKQRLNVPCFSP